MIGLCICCNSLIDWYVSMNALSSMNLFSHSQCSKSLQDDFIQYIKVRSSEFSCCPVTSLYIVQVDSEKQSNLPKDGTVHSLTSSVSSNHSMY